jgi:hypothetical protein
LNIGIRGRRKRINEWDEGLMALSFICGLGWIDGMGERAVLYALKDGLMDACMDMH